jgi:hypothetical protein
MANGLSTLALLAAVLAIGAPSLPAQSDLDAFMERVLARRDENWKKLQQYILDERESFRVTGPDGSRIYGYDRRYTWFIREGMFIRSPLVFDGVTIAEGARTQYEADWVQRERARERRQRERARANGERPPPPEEPPADAPDRVAPPVDSVLQGSLEPRFVSAAYFLRFKFDPGHYALAGRERLNDREVLRIEYYPSKLFTEGRTRPNRRARDRDEEIEEKMNKVSLVTLWIDPVEHQILQYTFDNIDMDFLPGRSIVRVDEMKASMKMAQPFPGVWLPASIDMNFGLTLAIGRVSARYEVQYQDYRLAEVKARVTG